MLAAAAVLEILQAVLVEQVVAETEPLEPQMVLQEQSILEEVAVVVVMIPMERQLKVEQAVQA
jgi:hypothetical protein